MPVMGGADATERIRETDWGKDMTIIAISASALDEEREVILSHGADAFVKKPFKEGELLEEIRHHAGIEYEYEEIEEDVQAGPAKEIDREAVKKLPAELKDKIKQTIVIGNMDNLEKMIPEIAETDKEIADYLQKLVDDFDLKKIQNIFK